MEFTALRTPLGRQFVPPGFLQASTPMAKPLQPRSAPRSCRWEPRHAAACHLPHPGCGLGDAALVPTPPLLGPPRHNVLSVPHHSNCHLQAAEASAEDGGLGSRYSFRQRFYSTLPPTLDNELRVGDQGELGWVSADTPAGD